MKKSIILSVQPQQVENMINGKQTIIIRKTMPKCELPIDVYLYCTQGKMLFKNENKYFTSNRNTKNYLVTSEDVLNGSIVAKFTLNTIDIIECSSEAHSKYFDSACLTQDELIDYCNGKDLYAWHINNLQIFDKPMEFSEFRSVKICPNIYFGGEDNDEYMCKEGYDKNAVVDKSRTGTERDECIYFDWSMSAYEYAEYAYCGCKGYKILTRPPQSYQFVYVPNPPTTEKNSEFKTRSREMNLNFTSIHLETLRDLQDITKKHNATISFGTNNTSETEFDSYVLEKNDIDYGYIDVLINGNCCELKNIYSESSKIWFQLYEKDTQKYYTMSFSENLLSFYLEIDKYSDDYEMEEYIEKFADEYLSSDYGDDYFGSFTYSPTIINGFGNKDTIEDFRVYRPDMALKFFADLVCDYLGEPRIERNY